MLKGFRMAGYETDNPGYYKLDKATKLTGQEIRDLVVGKTITGRSHGFTFSVKIKENGRSEINAFSRTDQGVTWVEGDRLCSQYENLYGGLTNCAEIFKNPQGNKQTLSEYFLLSNYWLNLFSVR